MDIRKLFTQRVIFELEWAPQGSGHSTNLNSRRIWTVLSSYRVVCSVQGQELNLMILMGPLQLIVLCDSMKILLE